MKTHNHHQPVGIIESIGWERSILDNFPLLFCDWEIKQIVPRFLTFFYNFHLLLSVWLLWRNKCFKMLQQRGKQKIFWRKEWTEREQKRKRQNPNISEFKASVLNNPPALRKKAKYLCWSFWYWEQTYNFNLWERECRHKIWSGPVSVLNNHGLEEIIVL